MHSAATSCFSETDGPPPIHVVVGECRPSADADLTALHNAFCELDVAGQDPERLELAVSNVIGELEAVPVFQSRLLIGRAGGEGLTGRFLSDSFVTALYEAFARIRALPSVMDNSPVEELKDAVCQLFANSTASRYECSAIAAWPKYAAVCSDLTARFQLAPSGLVTYTIGPAGVPAAWELSGEGCWRPFPDGGGVTEVELQMIQGLQGVGLTADGTYAREPPCSLRVDLRECARTMVDGSSGDDEEYWDYGGDDEGEDYDEGGGY